MQLLNYAINDPVKLIRQQTSFSFQAFMFTSTQGDLMVFSSLVLDLTGSRERKPLYSSCIFYSTCVNDWFP